MRVLWLEDEMQLMTWLYRKLVSELKIPEERITLLERGSDAKHEFERAARTDDPYTHALIDLSLETEAPKNHQGFDFLRDVRKASVGCSAIILSHFTDDLEARETKEVLEDKGVAANDVINKRWKAGIPALLRPHMLCVDEELRRLNESHMCATSRFTEDLVRSLKVWLEDLPEDPHGKLPSLLIRGHYGSGKSHLVEALPHIAPDVFGEAPDDVVSELNAANLTADGEGARVALMGARNFPRMDDAPGLFERATCYSANPRLATAQSRVVARPLKIAFLDEIQALHRHVDLSEQLLKVMDRGVVSPAGGAADLPVNCLFVAATRLEAADSASTESARPFYDRFGLTKTLAPVWDREDEWFEILKWCVAKRCSCKTDNVDLDEGTRERLERNVRQGLFNTRQLYKVASLARSCVPIITEAMVTEVEEEEKTKQLVRDQRREEYEGTVVVPMASGATVPAGRTQIVLPASESPAELAQAMRAALEALPASRRVSFRNWLRGDAEVFSSETAQFREDQWRMWADACLLLAFDLSDDHFRDRFVVTEKNGSPRAHWRWRDVINPCVHADCTKRTRTPVSVWLGGYPAKLDQHGKNLAFVEGRLRALAHCRDEPEGESGRACRELARRLFESRPTRLARRAPPTEARKDSE